MYEFEIPRVKNEILEWLISVIKENKCNIVEEYYDECRLGTRLKVSSKNKNDLEFVLFLYNKKLKLSNIAEQIYKGKIHETII